MSERESNIEKKESGLSFEAQEKAAERLENVSKEIGERNNINENERKSKEAEALVEAQEKAAEKTPDKKAKIEKEDKTENYPATKKQRDARFKQTMKSLQKDMPAPERVFSKFIHNKVVDKTSDVIGKTVARPNAVLSGAVCAFILTSVIYILARSYGYVLSGFETIGAFILGWLIGILIDYLRVLFTGKTS